MRTPEQPLVMFHGASRVYGRPNSVCTVRQAVLRKPDIVEVDVRQSRDGVLYCHHGWLVMTWTLKYVSWRWLKALLMVDSLADVARSVPSPTILFLDVKESCDISLIQQFCQSSDCPIWLASRSIDYLSKLRKQIGGGVVYIHNAAFLSFTRSFPRAVAAGINVTKVFGWQLHRYQLSEMSRQRIAFTISPYLMSRKAHQRAVSNHGSVWVSRQT